MSRLHVAFSAVLLSAQSHAPSIAHGSPNVSMQLGPYWQRSHTVCTPQSYSMQPGSVLPAMCTERGHRYHHVVTQTPKPLLPGGLEKQAFIEPGLTLHIIFFVCLFFFFWNRILFYSSGWPQICSIAHAGLEFISTFLPSSCSQMLGLQV